MSPAFTRSFVAILGFIVFAFAVNLFIGRTGGITIGSLEDAAVSDIVALTNSQGVIEADRYDSFESPRGTDYQVPAGNTLYLVAVTGWPEVIGSTDENLDIGYGDDAVNNSVAAPTNAVIVCGWTWQSVDGFPIIQAMFCPIPAGKYPFVFASGAGNYQVTGQLH